MAKQNSTYFSPTCFFCGKNNKRRHSRVGRTWTCGHCGEVNPGPGMVRSMMSKLGNGHAEKREPAPAAPRKVAVTTIRGTEVAAVETTKKGKAEPARKPAAAAPAATQKSKPTPKSSAPPPAPPKRGFLEGLVYG